MGDPVKMMQVHGSHKYLTCSINL